MKKKLELVLRTLDKINLSGRDNLDMMLGAMITIESVIEELDAEPHEAEVIENG